MARPEGLERLEGGFCATRQHTGTEKNQSNQTEHWTRVGPFRLQLYTVHGKSHGKFLGQPVFDSANNQPQDCTDLDGKIPHFARIGPLDLRSASAHPPDVLLQVIENA